MYATFIFSFTELTTAIPHAGGPFEYSRRAFGPTGGFIAGFATLIEFVFAPPAIALAIGAYLNVQFPALDAEVGRGRRLPRLHGAQHRRHDRSRPPSSWSSPCSRSSSCCVFMGVVAPGFSAAQLRARRLGRQRRVHAAAPGPACSPRSRSRSGSSSPSKAWRWPPRRRKDPKRSIPIAYIGGILTLVRAGARRDGLRRRRRRLDASSPTSTIRCRRR